MVEGAQDERVDGPETAAPADVDLARRRFFRQFAADAIQAAATVVGAANAIQQTSIQAASAILDPEAGAKAMAAATNPRPRRPSRSPRPASGPRSGSKASGSSWSTSASCPVG